MLRGYGSGYPSSETDPGKSLRRGLVHELPDHKIIGYRVAGVMGNPQEIDISWQSRMDRINTL